MFDEINDMELSFMKRRDTLAKKALPFVDIIKQFLCTSILPFETFIGDLPVRKKGIVPELVAVKDELTKMKEEFPERETLTSITIVFRPSR